jgi:hypothetical protein
MLRTALRVCLVAAPLALVSCGVSGKAFVDNSLGYSVTRGNIVRVDNLNTEWNNLLSDGVAIRISSPGCRVGVRMGQPVQELDLKPGSIVVLSKKGDFVLIPHQVLENADPSQVPGINGSSPTSSSAPAQGSSMREEPRAGADNVGPLPPRR